jgi:hypothetical protein
MLVIAFASFVVEAKHTSAFMLLMIATASVFEESLRAGSPRQGWHRDDRQLSAQKQALMLPKLLPRGGRSSPAPDSRSSSPRRASIIREREPSIVGAGVREEDGENP